MQDRPVALLSDTHDAKKNLTWALALLRERDVRRILFCGDLNSPAMLDYFNGFDPRFVLGNADRQEQAIEEKAEELFGPGRVAMVQTLDIDGKSVAVTHGHTKDLERLTEGQEYEYVIHGHTHRRRDEKRGVVRIINPGALGGIKRESRSFALLYPGTGKVEFHEIGE